MLALNILVVGLSGLTAQVLLLRELLVSFSGNELTLGIVLANWVILEAFGVFALGKYIDKVKDKVNVFIFLNLTFIAVLPLSIYLCRVFKEVAGVPYGAALGLYGVMGYSFLIALPLSFTHGALFSVSSKIYGLYTNEESNSIATVYTWETLGTILGGLVVTYLFIPYFTSFQIIVILAFLILSVNFLLLHNRAKPILRYSLALSMLLLSLISFSNDPDKLERFSIREQYKRTKVLDYRNSIYGNIVLTQQPGQYTFLYNGSPFITTPYPDISFMEDIGHLPLLFIPHPDRVLIVGSGVGGLINEVIKHPITQLDYAELDPLIVRMVKDHPTTLTERELSDKRLHIVNIDGRYFLKVNKETYDLILTGFTNLANLSTNRFFTREFFFEAKARLNKNGIVAFWVPGGLVSLSREVKDINNCVLNSLKDAFKYVRVLAGDYNIFIASDSRDIMLVTPALISMRIREQRLHSNILIPGYLDYKLNGSFSAWLEGQLKGATKKKNLDLRPYAVFKTMVFWNKQFSLSLGRLLELFEGLNLSLLALIGLLVSFILFFRFKSRNFALTYSILTTGFFGMTSSLLLIFAYQVAYGYLYQRIGLLTSIFMAGICLGSIFMARYTRKHKEKIRVFVALELSIIIFALLAGFLATAFLASFVWAIWVLLSLNFISGLLMGLEFSLASKIYIAGKGRLGHTSGVLYAADLLGGWVSGIATGIIFLPILGFFNTLVVVVILKLSSFALWLRHTNLLTRKRI